MKNVSRLLKFIWIPLLLAVTFNCSDDEAELKPSIIGVSPSEGVPGTAVTISGTNLKNISSVKFGSIDAAGFDATANTATSITATVPAGAAAGDQGITVSGPNGRAAIEFTVLEPTTNPDPDPEPEPEPAAPSISGVSPLEGPAGTEVLISGTNLSGATEVKFGDIVIAEFTATASTVTVVIPAEAAPGTETITVTTPGGVATVDYTVTEPVPVINSLSASSRVIGGRVSVNGANLQLVTSMKLGELEILPENFTINETGTKLTFTVPEGAVTGNVTLMTADGTEIVSTQTLTVPLPPPFTFNPVTGPAGTEVTITGSGFTAESALMFGTTPITPLSVSEDGTQIVFVIPAETAIGTSGKITIGDVVSPNNFHVVQQGLVADFDTDALLKWPQNTISQWGWGIPDADITNTAEGIVPIDEYFALINTDLPSGGVYANEKVINLVDWTGRQIFPVAPASVYDPAAPASDFVIKMNIAVAQPASLADITLQVSAYNANGDMANAFIPLADVVTTTDGTWYSVSVPVSSLGRTGTTGTLVPSFTTYGDFLTGGLVAEDTGLFGRHLRVSVNNNAAAETEAVPATIAIDNIMIVKAGE